MATPNFKTQQYFDLYATDNFVVYPYELDENDEFVLDDKGEPIINYEIEPFFDYQHFKYCKEFTEDNLNSKLRFFTISFEDGYYSGVQTFIEPKYPNDFNALDFLYSILYSA